MSDVSEQGIRDYFGKNIEVLVSTFEGKNIVKGLMKEIEFPVSMEIALNGKYCRFSFAGEKDGIISVADECGKTIYSNQEIPIPYPSSQEEIEKLRMQCFGGYYGKMNLSKEEIQKILDEKKLAAAKFNNRDILW